MTGPKKRLMLASLSFLAPGGARPIDLPKWRRDAARRPELVDGARGLRQPVVVHDDHAPARHPVVKTRKTVHRRAVEIPIQTQKGDALDGCRRQCVLEPSGQKADARTQQIEALERLSDGLQVGGE